GSPRRARRHPGSLAVPAHAGPLHGQARAGAAHEARGPAGVHRRSRRRGRRALPLGLRPPPGGGPGHVLRPAAPSPRRASRAAARPVRRPPRPSSRRSSEVLMPATPTDRPHILLIISDDHGYGDLSSRGSADARTPHLDRLAAEGMSFDSAYVTAPICSPSRAGLIAGAHQQRWGGHWFSDSSFPPAPRPVLPELLGEGGYRTGYFGKVHYGFEQPGDRACPERHGFDCSFYGMTSTSAGRLHYLHHSRASRERLGDDFHAVHGVNPMFDGGREVDCE